MRVIPTYGYEQGVPTIHLGIVGLLVIAAALVTPAVVYYLKWRKQHWYRGMEKDWGQRVFIKSKVKV